MSNERDTGLYLPDLISPELFAKFGDRLHEAIFPDDRNRCMTTHQQTRRILTELGLGDNADKLVWLFESAGGFCDCEVGLNVLANPERLLPDS